MADNRGMKIPASQVTSAAAAARQTAQPLVRPTRTTDVTGTPVQAAASDKVDLSRQAQGVVSASTQGQTTSERVASFADKVHQRLENLAQSLDPRSSAEVWSPGSKYIGLHTR